MATDWLLVENNAKTTLNGAVAGVDVTITVASAADFPATGNFYVTVWDAATFSDPGDDHGSGSGGGMEVMLVTGVAGAVFTVTRAQADTAAVAHGNGDAVRLLLLAEHMEQITGVVTANETHVGSDGSDHTFVDQAVTIAGTPRFARVGIGAAADANILLSLVGTPGSATAMNPLMRLSTAEACIALADNYECSIGTVSSGRIFIARNVYWDAVNNMFRKARTDILGSVLQVGAGGQLYFYTTPAGGSVNDEAVLAIRFYVDSLGIHTLSMKTGTTQAAAGAAAGELWADTADVNSVKLGT